MSEPDGGPGFDAALDLVTDVPGWLSEPQARRLWDAARALTPPARIVEIGSFRGRSTIILALAAADGVEVVAIDPHAGSDRGPQEIAPDARLGEDDHRAFTANLARAGVGERVRHLRRPSREALGELTGAVDLLFVDGAHRYAPARDDIARWGERVAPGGTMLVHDAYSAIGVTLAQLRLLLLSAQWRYEGRTGTLARYRRTTLSPARRLANALRQALGLPYFARNELVKLLLLARLAPLTRLLGHRGGDWPY